MNLTWLLGQGSNDVAIILQRVIFCPEKYQIGTCIFGYIVLYFDPCKLFKIYK